MCVNTVVCRMDFVCDVQATVQCTVQCGSSLVLLATHFWGNDGNGPILGLVFLSLSVVVSYESTQHHNMCTVEAVESTAHCS